MTLSFVDTILSINPEDPTEDSTIYIDGIHAVKLIIAMLENMDFSGYLIFVVDRMFNWM